MVAYAAQRRTRKPTQGSTASMQPLGAMKKKKKMKQLPRIFLVLILIIIGMNCSSTKSKKLEKAIALYEEKKRAEFQQIKTIADEYLNSKISEGQLLNQIKFDTIYRSSSNLVIYNIENQNKILRNNMILVIVDSEMKVDLTNTKLYESEIKSYIEYPEKNKLLLSRNDLIRIAKQNEIEAGIKPWEIHLTISGKDMNNINWCLRNTLSESNRGSYRASGKSMCVNIFNEKIEMTSWESIS